MPATYLSHQAPTLALKMWRPRWFDGTAMAFGSMAPDWAYVLVGSRFAFDAHTPAGIVLFCTPTSVAAACVLRRLVPAIAVQLPDRFPLPTRDLAYIAGHRPALWLTAQSAFLGATSHVVWDEFTHTQRFVGRHVGWVHDVQITVAGHALTGAKVLQVFSSVFGAVIALALLGLIRSRRLLPAWGAPVPLPTPVGGLRFWYLPAFGTLAGEAWAMGTRDHAAAVNRIVLAGLGGLLLSAALSLRASGASSRRPVGPWRGSPRPPRTAGAEGRTPGPG
jgi:hypothetical protein